LTRTEIVEAARADLECREVWDSRQSMFYEMRHHGLRRTNKPWPNASDVHFPLCDSAIERLKPIYFQQLFASDVLAHFIPDDPGMQSQELATSAALWFDYQIRHGTDYERQLLHAFDYLLWGGRSAVKITWNPDKNRVDFLAIPAQLLIVPAWTTTIDEADRVVHVQRYSPEAYRRQPQFRQGEDFIRSITGNGDTDDSAEMETKEVRYLREGLTNADDDTIIAWECWTRDKDGKWGFEVLSPLVPEEPIRPRVTVPYNHGEPPFAPFVYEEKEGGWYSSRGVVEILATFEAELCKLWNEKNDCMTLSNRPLFTSQRDMGSSQNLRWLPGQILPFGLTPVVMPQPPVSFDTQTIMVRDIANNLVNIPSFPTQRASGSSEPKTATEIEAMTQSSTQSADLRMRVCRMGLANLYRLTWSVLQQYKAGEVRIWVNNTVSEIPPEAIAGRYRIEPSGSADGLTRQQSHAKSLVRLQVLQGSPFVDQAELTRTVLEADDPGMVKRLFRDPDQQAADQIEQQGNELACMLLGFPASVSPADNHVVHLQAILDFILRMGGRNSQTPPEAMQMVMPHTIQHLDMLRQTDPKAAKQMEQAFARIAQAAQGANQGQPGMPQPIGAVQPSGPASPGPAMASGPMPQGPPMNP
jgi:hypothetical protein